MRKENKSHTDKLCVIRLISTIGILGCVNTNECVGGITYSFSLHVGIYLEHKLKTVVTFFLLFQIQYCNHPQLGSGPFNQKNK